jgi:hypothetical protein
LKHGIELAAAVDTIANGSMTLVRGPFSSALEIEYRMKLLLEIWIAAALPPLWLSAFRTWMLSRV